MAQQKAAAPELCIYPCNPWITSRGPSIPLETHLAESTATTPFSPTIYDSKVLTIADNKVSRGAFMTRYDTTSEWVLVFDESPGSNEARGDFQVALMGSSIATYQSSGAVLSAIQALLPSAVWDSSVVKVVTCAAVSLLKFSQIDDYRSWLLHSGGAYIIKSSKDEGTWGVAKSPYEYLDALGKGRVKLLDNSLTYKDRRGSRPRSFTYFSSAPNPSFDSKQAVSYSNQKETFKKFHSNVIDSNCLGKALMIARAILSRETEARPRTSLPEAFMEVLALLKETVSGSLRHNLKLGIVDTEVLPAIMGVNASKVQEMFHKVSQAVSDSPDDVQTAFASSVHTAKAWATGTEANDLFNKMF